MQLMHPIRRHQPTKSARRIANGCGKRSRGIDLDGSESKLRDMIGVGAPASSRHVLTGHVLTGHSCLRRRCWLYTGVTRGKRLAVLVGQRKALAIAVKGARIRRRCSKLREWLGWQSPVVPELRIRGVRPVKGLHRWAFKSRFRARAYGWRGSALAGKRLKEAVGEITVVVKSDRVLAGEGTVSLLERLWPALQDIDKSSGVAYAHGKEMMLRSSAFLGTAWRPR